MQKRAAKSLGKGQGFLPRCLGKALNPCHAIVLHIALHRIRDGSAVLANKWGALDISSHKNLWYMCVFYRSTKDFARGSMVLCM